MKCSMLFIAALVVAGAPAVSADPLGKVFELMSALEAKIKKEGEEEAKAFNDYFAWCDDATANLHNEIKTGGEKKEELEATISKCKADIEACSVKIEDLSGAISADEKELKEATAVRNKEVAVFKASEKELVDAIDTLERAVGVLEKEMSKNPASLAQIDTSNLDNVIKGMSAIIDAASFTAQDHAKLTALVQQQQGSDEDEFGAPAAAVYKSHSGGIFDVLGDMKEKAEAQLNDLRKAESTSKHNYDMLKQSLEDEMAADTKDMEEEKSLKAATEERQATADGDLAETVKELAKDKESLKVASSTCMTVAADHEATVKSRNEELAAIAQAEKILKESTGGAQQQSYSFLQMHAQSRLQSKTDMKNAEVVTLVKKLAHDHHSAALAQLASRIKAVMSYGAADRADVFGKVKGLISDMITKLEKEAESEASEKAYCDEEMSKTEAKKGELEGTITKLTSKIDLAAAKSAELKGEVKTLQKELAQIAKEQAEMDAIRREENGAYVSAKADLESGLGGIRKALSVLREFYAAPKAALMQTDDDEDEHMGSLMQEAATQPAPPQKAEKSTGAGNGIIGMLEVCESDFAKNLATEDAEESDAQSSYDKQTQANKIAKAEKEQDVKFKTQEFKALDKSIADLTADKATEVQELGAVNEYFSKIKERCVAKPSTYEERKARRDAEVKGLKDALAAIDTESLMQIGGSRSGRRSHLRGEALRTD